MGFMLDESTRAVFRDNYKLRLLHEMAFWAKMTGNWNFEQRDAWGYYSSLINPYERQMLREMRRDMMEALHVPYEPVMLIVSLDKRKAG